MNGVKSAYIMANKRRCILGKDLSHRKWILLSLPLGPTDTLLLLRELAFLVLFALLLASRRPDKRRRYKFCGWKKRNPLNITKKQYWPPGPALANEPLPGLANTVA